MSNSVKILGRNCDLHFGKYPNGTVAITAKQAGESVAVCTVNWESNWNYGNYAEKFKFPVVVIKDYSENEGVFKSLLLAGVIMQGPYMEGTGGTVHVCQLTDEWKLIAKQQLDNE